MPLQSKGFFDQLCQSISSRFTVQSRRPCALRGGGARGSAGGGRALARSTLSIRNHTGHSADSTSLFTSSPYSPAALHAAHTAFFVDG